MKILKLNPQKSKAQAIVEFAIALPVLLLLLYGLLEAGRFLFIIQSVNNATRQAARYGSTSGEGPNGVPRYQDCAEIRAAAQRVDFLNSFDDNDITITYDHGSGSAFDTCNGPQDAGVGAVTGDRVTVAINADFNAVVPKLVPFISRTVANGNPIVGRSSRTLLLTIQIASSGGGGSKEATNTAITADEFDPSEIGQSVRVDVTVTGTTTPTGTVDITGADVNCSITLTNGSGSCNVTFNTIAGSSLPETRTLVATYNGDTSHNSSSDSETHTVNKASTTTTIVADAPDPSAANAQVAVTVSVTSAWPNITGTVTITGADTNCTITLPATSCNVNFGSNGTKTLTATYNGDTQHAISSDTETHTVANINDTTTTITSPASFTTQTPTFTVNVAPVSGTANGTVTFREGSTTLCIATLSGNSGSCTSTVTLTPGTHNITATYTSTNGKNGSNASQTITVGGTVTTITAGTPSNGVVPITATVTGGGTPTGTVAITGADTNCTITLSGGTGTCNVTFTSSVTNQTLTGTYSGDSTHAGSSGTTNVTVTVTSTLSCAISSYAVNNWNDGNGGFGATLAIKNTGTTTINSGWTLTWNFPGTQQVTQMWNPNSYTQSGKLVTATNGPQAINAGATYNNMGFNGTNALPYPTNNYPTDFKLNGVSCTPPPVTACNTVTVGLLKKTSGAMTMQISNPLPSALLIKDMTVQWNHDKGHQTGTDKSLRLQSANIGGNTFWTGDQAGATYTITPASSAFIPTGTSTMTLNFHQSFDNWDDTESITINLSTPGCETVILFRNQH